MRDEGYEISVRGGHVVVANVPYVTGERAVERASLVIALTESGDRTGSPPDHTVMWTGEMPCHQDGTPIARIDAGATPQDLGDGLVVRHRFSSKPLPAGRYDDYYAQFAAYARIVSYEAQALDPTATACTFAPVETSEDDTVFVYADTASSRAGIQAASEKLRAGKLVIVGLGGTGSYVLDLLAKAPVGEIHLYDGDDLLNHNAFRAPGAVPFEALQGRPKKVDYFAGLYSQMRRGIHAHAYHLDASNVHELNDADFVFLCMDSGPDKRAIVEHLMASETPFVDSGMGLHEEGGAVAGIVRATSCTSSRQDHVLGRVSFEDPDDGVNEYVRNIQVADLNALNAALAVIRWKKHCGFYRDLEGEHHTLYTVDGNHLLNEDSA